MDFCVQLPRLRLLALFFCISCVAISFARPAQAAEGGTSYYFPGLYGDFGVGVAPDPGVYFFNTSTFYRAEATGSFLPGNIDKSLGGVAYINLIRGFWVSDLEILGARFVMGLRLPILHVAIDAELETPFGVQDLNFTNWGLGDIGVIPVSLYWKFQNFHINLYQAVTGPSGNYNQFTLANVSRNQWSFDTVLALTWLDLQRGFEISAVPGVIFNTENPTTDYRSGTEFHMDIMLNRFFTPKFAVGLHGSIYRQLTADSGAGAVLGPFKGKASTIGPALLYRPQIAGKQGYIAAKWLHEFDVENRFQGDLFILTAGIKF